MEHDRTIRSFGLKIITIAAIAILLFSTYTIFVMDNDGEGNSNALLSVDEGNEFKVIKKNDVVVHNIEVANVGVQPIIILLTADVIHVSAPGSIGNWSVRFLEAGVEITNTTIIAQDSKIIAVEVFASYYAVLHETATIKVTAQDAILPLSGPTNTSSTSQNNIAGEELILTTRVGTNYNPFIEIVPGTKDSLQVNALSPTTYRVKVSNLGFKLDSIRLIANVGSPVRGETRASETWRVSFSPSSLVQDLNSINDGVGYYAIVYVNVTAPTTAVFGHYPITITAGSVGGNDEDSMQIIARVPVPDLYAKAEDITFSRFPVMNGQDMIINITIHNNGGAVEDTFDVEFWMEDTIKAGDYTIIGIKTISPIGSQQETYATIKLTPELHPSIDDPITRPGIRIEIDPLDDITETDEDNNRVESDIEIIKEPATSPGYSASLMMIVGMVAVAAILAVGHKWKLSRKNDRE